jgi:hypothetical protein
MLTGVQHQEELACPNAYHQGLGKWAALLFPHTEHRGHGVRYQGRVRNRLELNEAYPIRKLVQGSAHQLNREARLATAGRTPQGQ